MNEHQYRFLVGNGVAEFLLRDRLPRCLFESIFLTEYQDEDIGMLNFGQAGNLGRVGPGTKFFCS